MTTFGWRRRVGVEGQGEEKLRPRGVARGVGFSVRIAALGEAIAPGANCWKAQRVQNVDGAAYVTNGAVSKRRWPRGRVPRFSCVIVALGGYAFAE